MPSYERGFRRAAWVLIALSLPIIGVFAYEFSSTETGLKPVPLLSDFPPVGSGPPGTKIVRIKGVGYLYAPDSLTQDEILQLLLKYFPADASERSPNKKSISEFAASVRAKYPEYQELEDVELTKRVLTKYPVYRSAVNFTEYRLVPTYEKRPWWAVKASLVAVAALAVILYGTISAVAWIARGFTAT